MCGILFGIVCDFVLDFFVLVLCNVVVMWL